MLRLLTIIVCLLALWCVESHAYVASSERITKEKACHSVAVWAVGIFNVIKQNPTVILNGMDQNDDAAFVFIRQWVADGKSRDELYKYTFNHCSGTEV